MWIESGTVATWQRNVPQPPVVATSSTKAENSAKIDLPVNVLGLLKHVNKSGREEAHKVTKEPFPTFQAMKISFITVTLDNRCQVLLTTRFQ